MQRRTALALAGLLLSLAALGAVALGVGGVLGPGGGHLSETWVSDTARDNEVNHHAVGVGPDGRVIVAPVAAVPNAEEITETSCSLVRLSTDAGRVEWRATVRPDRCFTHALTEPAVADADGDGALEAVVATTENALVAYAASDGGEEFRVPLPSYGYGRPAVGDLAIAPGPETVVADIGGGVTVVDGDGTVLWQRALNETTWVPPVVADVDGDGTTEALVATGKRVVLFGPDGTVEWRSDGGATTLAAGQVDADPATELVLARTGRVAAIDGADGTVEWSTAFEKNPSVGAVGDGDGDGGAEAYVGFNDQRVVALDAATGEREWETEASAGTAASMPAPRLGDVDGDGDGEVVAVTADGTVAVLAPDSGAELAAYEREVPVWTHPTLADVDGDGASEILVRYGDGRVAALDYVPSD